MKMTLKNNPFNIRYSKQNNWWGQTKPYKGFAQFDCIENGIRAGMKLLKTYRATLGFNTVRQIVSRYAPQVENDTETYIRYICEHCGAKPDETLPDWENEYFWVNFGQSIARYESGHKYDITLFENGYNAI